MLLDLPPDSLGPKPTKKQMALLKLMAAPSTTIHIWSGTSLGSGGAYLKIETQKHDYRVTRRDVDNFFDYGWIESIGGDWKSQDYRISDRGKKVIEKGITR